MSLSVLNNAPEDDAALKEEQRRFREEELKKFEGKAQNYVNDENVEKMWAEKAFKHTQVYYRLICTINCTKLKLTKFDDEIYHQFMISFPRVKIDVIDDEKLKSVGAKRRWRNYCNLFENHVDDFNFGTLLRLDCKEGYSEVNTTLVPRVQFLAIEIARNRHGLNMCHLGKDPNPKKKEDKDKENVEENNAEDGPTEDKPGEV